MSTVASPFRCALSKIDLMKLTNKIFTGLAIALIILQVLAHLSRAGMTPSKLRGINAIMFYIGLNSFGILGLLFLVLAWYLRRRIKKSEDKKLVDSIGMDNYRD
jgi:hypothetical protein